MVLLFFYSIANTNEGRYFCEEQSFVISVGKPGFFLLNTSILFAERLATHADFARVYSDLFYDVNHWRDTQWGAFAFKSVKKTDWRVTSHAGVFMGARISFFPTNACSTEDNIPFPSLANQIVPSKFWKVDLDRRVPR